MVAIIIKVILGLFIWLALEEILSKQLKLKKSTKKFVSLSCKIAGLAVVLFAGIDFVKLLLSFH
jgi:hypothetical protein